MKIFRQDDSTCAGQRGGHYRDVGIPASSHLESLPHILTEHDFRLHQLPYAQALKSLARRTAVWGMRRVRNGYVTNVRILEGFDRSEAGLSRPKDQPADRVDPGLTHQACSCEPLDKLLIGGEKDIEWSAILNLTRERSARAEAESGAGAALTFEARGKGNTERGEVGGRGDREFLGGQTTRGGEQVT